MAKTVIYGVKGLSYAVETDTGTGITVGSAVSWPGTVNWTCTPRTEGTAFEADDDPEFFASDKAVAYDISVEVASVPDSFKTDVLGATETSGKIVYNKSDAVKHVTLSITRTVNNGSETTEKLTFHHCRAKMPKMFDAATAANKAPKTVTIEFVCTGNPYTGDLVSEE